MGVKCCRWRGKTATGGTGAAPGRHRGGKGAEERTESGRKNLKIDLEINRSPVIFVKTEHCGFDKWSMRKEKSIWLVTTDHLEDGLWFREEADFKVGMNYVAVLAASMPALAILAFILMSNHVHFILFGTREDVDAFIGEFKRRYSQYYRKKYGIAKFLKENGVKTDRIPSGNEEPEKAIAYVQMNSVAANICSHPTQYPWGTGNLFFNATRPKGVRVDSLSERERMKLLHSKVTVPGHWLVGEDGYILPSSYVDIVLVEKYFRTPKRMDYFLRNSSKAKRRMESAPESAPSFTDQVVLAAVPDLCRTLFHKYTFRELTPAERTEILRQLRFRFSTDIHQLARVTGLTYKETAELLDSHL